MFSPEGRLPPWFDTPVFGSIEDTLAIDGFREVPPGAWRVVDEPMMEDRSLPPVLMP